MHRMQIKNRNPKNSVQIRNPKKNKNIIQIKR